MRAGVVVSVIFSTLRGRLAQGVLDMDSHGDAVRSEPLVEIYRSLDSEMSRIWSLILTAAPDDQVLQIAHAGSLQLLERQDGDHAAEVARAFIEASHALAVRVLRDWLSRSDTEIVPLRR